MKEHSFLLTQGPATLLLRSRELTGRDLRSSAGNTSRRLSRESIKTRRRFDILSEPTYGSCGIVSRLTAEVVVANLAPVSAGNTGQDKSKPCKRRSQRYTCNLAAGWRLLGAPDLQFMTATLDVISQSGFELRVRNECKKGAILSIRLEIDSDKLAGPWLGQVVNVRKDQTGSWIVGCRLCSEFTEAELQAILNAKAVSVPDVAATSKGAEKPKPALVAPPPTAQIERRTTPRRNGKRIAVIVALSNGKRYSGRVVNGSAKGLALAMPHSMAVGAVVKVRASNAGLAVPWANVQVKHCHRANHEWIVGCQFSDALTAAILDTLCTALK